jgi:hypothetical protein
MNYIAFIGTSRIINDHILASKKNNFKTVAICSSRKKSKFLKVIAKKNRIRNTFYSLKKFINFTQKYKNISYVVAPNISYNEKILKELIKYKNKILIEKPISKNEKKIKFLINYKRQIFVGYNRVYYKNIKFMKKKLSGKKNIIVRCNIPEKNLKNINTNSCHIISILLHLFGSLKFKLLDKSKKFIFCLLYNSKVKIFINFIFTSPENFSISINENKILYQLKPIEKLSIYNSIKVFKKGNETFYLPKIKKTINEYSIHKRYKPGFITQYQNFRSFINGNYSKNYIDIIKAHKIVKICNLISSQKFK